MKFTFKSTAELLPQTQDPEWLHFVTSPCTSADAPWPPASLPPTMHRQVIMEMEPSRVWSSGPASLSWHCELQITRLLQGLGSSFLFVNCELH